MSKMRYFSNKFSKISKRWELSAPSASLPFDNSDLKLRDLAKLWCFKLIITKSNFVIIFVKYFSRRQWRYHNFSEITSLKCWTFQWRHHNYVTEKRHQNIVTKIFHFGPSQSKFLATPVDKSNYNCNNWKNLRCNYNCNWTKNL